jgi:transcriptional regulator with XRE-family HTH domain
MANAKDWLNQKFAEWEKSQGSRQSYYAFARFLDVSQSGLGQWMTGASMPGGNDLLTIAEKLGPEIYEIMGLPRPNAEVQRVTVSFAALPADMRQRLTNAIAEADQTLRQQRLRPDMPEARVLVIAIMKKWGFTYSG